MVARLVNNRSNVLTRERGGGGNVSVPVPVNIHSSRVDSAAPFREQMPVTVKSTSEFIQK